MRGRLVFAAMIALVSLAGCNSGDDGSSGEDRPEGPSDPIGEDQVNRYQLAFGGEVTADHTGGLLCRVDEGVFSMDFGIDAYDGPISYTVSVLNFDPGNSALEGIFTYNDSSSQSEGPVELTFGLGDPPDGYEGVVRAAGVLTGSMTGTAGTADISGTYACFLMDAEVQL